MQKSNVPCIKTGDFARLCGTNKRTLFHYDEIGLFHPAYTDEKGYRYYCENQFDVFFTITCLKELGMPLKEIGAFLEHRNPQSLKELLQRQERQLEIEEQRVRKLRQVIENKLSLMSLQEQLEQCGMPASSIMSECVDIGAACADESAAIPENATTDMGAAAVSAPDYYFEEDSRSGRIYIEETPEEYLILSEPVNSSDHEIIIHTLCEHIGRCNHENLNAGHPYGAMLTVDDLRKAQYDQYAYFFTKVTEQPTGIDYHIKPAGTYAVAYLRGDYYHCRCTYEALFQWIASHHKRTGQYSYKEAVIDELATPNSQDYLTKISIQIVD